MRSGFLLAASIALALPALAQADATTGWTGTGELGMALARGNARSENLNTKLAFLNEDDRWKHSFGLAALRAKGEVVGDFDGDGVAEERFELNANRYELTASSALKVSDVSSWVASLRHEDDDFAPFEHQTTFAIGYGRTLINSESTTLAAEVGPGFRRAKVTGTGENESDTIVRGQLNFKHKLTANTELGNLLLVESGSDNTFAQNDFGVTVAMNESFALKAGLQVRHNTEAAVGIDKTDTLTTVNLVYNFK